MKIPDCGVPEVSKGRIVGGKEVSPYSIPWQVGFIMLGFPRPLCGGTLISSNHVLSAAHCFDSSLDNYIYDFEVIVGEHSVRSRNDGDGTRHEVCHHAPHPKYRRELKTFQENWWDDPKTEWIGFYDFEIIRITIPVKIGIRAVPACLPPPRILNELRGGDILTVSGWGVPKYGENPPNPPDDLHSADVPFISNERCKEKSYLTRQLHENRALTESMLCAGHVEGGVDACQMDSGGKFKLTLTRWSL